MGQILLCTRLFLFCCPFDSQKASAGMHRNVTQLELPKWFCTVSETYRKGQHRLTPFEIIVFVLFRPKRGGNSDIWQVINRCDAVRSFRWYDDLMCFIINTVLTISAIWKLFYGALNQLFAGRQLSRPLCKWRRVLKVAQVLLKEVFLPRSPVEQSDYMFNKCGKHQLGMGWLKNSTETKMDDSKLQEYCNSIVTYCNNEESVGLLPCTNVASW